MCFLKKDSRPSTLQSSHLPFNKCRSWVLGVNYHHCHFQAKSRDSKIKATTAPTQCLVDKSVCFQSLHYIFSKNYDIFLYFLFFISILFYAYSSVLPGDSPVNIYREFLCVKKDLTKDLDLAWKISIQETARDEVINDSWENQINYIKREDRYANYLNHGITSQCAHVAIQHAVHCKEYIIFKLSIMLK